MCPAIFTASRHNESLRFYIPAFRFLLYPPSCMSMFQKARDMYSLQKQAKTLKKELKNIHIEAEVEGVIVIINGEQEVISVTIPETAHSNPKKLQENLRENHLPKQGRL